MTSEYLFGVGRHRAPHHPGRRKSLRHAARVAAALLLLLAAAPPHSAGPPAAAPPPQRGKPNIANDVEGTEKKKSHPPAGAPRQPEAKTARRRYPPPAAAPRSQPLLLNVTISTDTGDADVFLRRPDSTLQKVGRTGPDGKLSLRLPRGTHSIAVSRVGRSMRRQQIEVRPGSTTFSIAAAAGPPAAEGAAVASAAPRTAAEVIKRYLDPKQTAGVTLADWQAAHAQAGAAYSLNSVEPQLEAQALFTQGQLAYLRGDYASALVAFNNAALVLPTSALAYFGLGNAYLATSQPSESARAYQRAIELNSNLALAHAGLGDALLRQGKSREALNYFGRARALGYTSAETSLSVARALLRQKRWAQALKELTQVAAVRPSAEVFGGIGDSHVGLGQPLSAAPAYRRAMELDPGSAAAHYKYGALAYGMREYAAAMDALERALALDPAGTSIDRARAREMVDRSAQRLRRAK